jgi:hypothetical protein
MAESPHWASPQTWADAGDALTFCPVEPTFTAGCNLQGLRIFIRNHKMRELAVGERTLEAHYGRFGISQSRRGVEEARRLALDVHYGRDPRAAAIFGHSARLYELGPVPEPDDIDGRSPAVLTWHDGEMFFLISSVEMTAQELVPIAQSMYPLHNRGDDDRRTLRGPARP